MVVRPRGVTASAVAAATRAGSAASAPAGGLDGQVDGEGAPLARPALDRHPAAVGLDDVLHDREPQAAPLDVVHQAGAHAVEAVEDLALLVARDADPLVARRR